MNMIDYIKEIKRQLRDIYHFKPNGGTTDCPRFDSIPDGEYPMRIDGRLDNVKIEGGQIHCGKF